jgi:hypothetical protein
MGGGFKILQYVTRLVNHHVVLCLCIKDSICVSKVSHYLPN